MTLTESDLTLLRNIAGGFNYNRVGVLPTERFSANVSWANADALNALIERADAKPPTQEPPESGFVYLPAWGGGSNIKFPAAPGVKYVVPFTAEDDSVMTVAGSVAVVPSANLRVYCGVSKSPGELYDGGGAGGAALHRASFQPNERGFFTFMLDPSGPGSDVNYLVQFG